MLDRDAIWALAGLSAALWAIGGAGPKWARRFVQPVLLGLTFYAQGRAVKHRGWRSMTGVVALAMANSLGYGESKLPGYRLMVFTLLGVALLPFGVAWWYPVVMGAVLAVGFWVSRRGWVTWKLWELLAGALQGGGVAWAILR